MPAETPIAAPEVSLPNIQNKNGRGKPTLPRIALAGNPRRRKNDAFQCADGMRQKVGNYPGVTVERKKARRFFTHGREIAVLDLPGTYSLSPKSPDEEVARDVLLGLRPDTPISDASDYCRGRIPTWSEISRHAGFHLGIPPVAQHGRCRGGTQKCGRTRAFAQQLGAPVVPLIANKGEGVPLLKATLLQKLRAPRPPALNFPKSCKHPACVCPLHLPRAMGVLRPDAGRRRRHCTATFGRRYSSAHCC